MDSKTFGQLALQLLQQASVPGEALEAALAFKNLAKALAEDRAKISEDLVEAA